MQSAAASVDVAVISGELARSGHLDRGKNVPMCVLGRSFSAYGREKRPWSDAHRTLVHPRPRVPDNLSL
eukprot:scaffold48482_cov27-Phaeocystis_antarctica.AAC.1